MLLKPSLSRIIDDLLTGMPAADVVAGEEQARSELAEMAMPLRPDDDASARRRELLRLAATLAARAGRPQELVGLLLRDWHDGASARLPVSLLIAMEDAPFAATVARCALSLSDCQEREALEELLAITAQPPEGWTEVLLAFARAPTLEAWDGLHRFTPGDVYYDRVRNALRLLRGVGVDPVLLFGLATRHGTTPDAIELIDTGLVPAEVVAARGDGSPAASIWLALAAVAAQVRGDTLGVVRCLRRAWLNPDDYGMVHVTTVRIRAQADPELQRLLDAAGVPHG